MRERERYIKALTHVRSILVAEFDRERAKARPNVAVLYVLNTLVNYVMAEMHRGNK